MEERRVDPLADLPVCDATTMGSDMARFRSDLQAA
jgi:hypothetical protein